MNIVLIIILSVIGGIIFLRIVFGIFGFFFVYKKRKKQYSILDEKNKKRFDEYYPKIIEKYNELQKIEKEEIHILNKRNNNLYGELIKNKNQKNEIPTVILFSHGHLSSGENDLPLFYNFQLKNYDVLLTDHEAHGKSEGKYSGFGIYESENIPLWVEKINEIYNHKVNIFIHGVSLGANSVLLTADKEMENVRGLIGDCGFTSTFRILKKLTFFKFISFSICSFNSIVIKRNIFKYDTKKTLKNSKYPIILFHGVEDDHVPYLMSVENKEACTTKRKLIGFDQAKHAQSYLSDPIKYERAFNEFIKENSILA